MKKYDRYIGKEDQFQKTVSRYLDSLGLIWFHSPNEIKAKVQYMAKRKSMGVKSGVPDVMIFNTNSKYNGLAIELKAGYNKPSESQLEWLDKLTSLGWFAIWSNSLDEVLETIDNYIKIK